MDGMKKDLLEKRARFISRNMELIQEFSFAHPVTKCQVNEIYNFHFTGSPLWDLFSREAEMLENSFNLSVRSMYDIPRESHRYFIEGLTGKPHLKATLIKRFLSFTEQIMASSKIALKNLFEIVKYDTQSVTGNNLRKIMLLLNKNRIEDLKPIDSNKIEFMPIPDTELWKLEMVREITDIKFGVKALDNFPHEELDILLEHICTS